MACDWVSGSNSIVSEDSNYGNCRTKSNKPLQIACKNVVLANGSSDLANRLGLPNENMALSWLKHELPQLESALERAAHQNRSIVDPVLIVGAGLSAADAVTICRSSKIPVIHVYRNRTAGLDKMLPENVYPEYHEVSFSNIVKFANVKAFWIMAVHIKQKLMT